MCTLAAADAATTAAAKTRVAKTAAAIDRFRFKPKLLDLAIFAVALATVIFVSLRVYSDSGNILYVHINGESGEWIEALDANTEVEVPGPLGPTYVHIEDGGVSISDSPCDNKLCIGMGTIRLKHQWVACLPNNVFVRIAGRTSSEDTIDAATY